MPGASNLLTLTGTACSIKPPVSSLTVLALSSPIAINSSAFPTMIEQLSRETRAADFRELLRFGHRRVRALRNERIERGNAAARQKFCGDGKEKVGVVVARLVGDDREDALAGFDNVECFVNDRRES